ncbi:MAG: hypothetical protein AAFX86_06550 [Pseudomonadota bacterium]
MIEAVIISLIRQAAGLTESQQDDFTTMAADALATLIRSTQTGIDDVLMRDVALPMGEQIISKLKSQV